MFCKEFTRYWTTATKNQWRRRSKKQAFIIISWKSRNWKTVMDGCCCFIALCSPHRSKEDEWVNELQSFLANEYAFIVACLNFNTDQLDKIPWPRSEHWLIYFRRNVNEVMVSVINRLSIYCLIFDHHFLAKLNLMIAQSLNEIKLISQYCWKNRWPLDKSGWG